MPLINSSYFIGERNIPNTSYPEILSSLNNLIAIREKEYILKSLGYELFKGFWLSLANTTPAQRYVDILLGKEFTGMDGTLQKWDGLVSESSNTFTINPLEDIFFTVGTLGAPANGTDTYTNSSLAGLNYTVTQRGFGPLEELKGDNSNVSTADIQILTSGGFKWLGATRFTQSDKYQIQFIGTVLTVSGYDVQSIPKSPIADYIYFYWLKQQHTQTSGIGEVRAEGQNSIRVSSKHKAAATWNDMSEKTCMLKEFLIMSSSIYPEFQQYAGSRELWYLTSKINTFF